MSLVLDDTIVAISSGLAPAKRAVVRVSGPATRDILSQLIVDSPEAGELLAARHATCQSVRVHTGLSSKLHDSADDAIDGHCYYWPDNRSFTGQPTAELHILGSLPIVESLIEHICALGARPADRGEFTLRSFVAGKLDLPQAEAVLGVIEAESEDDLHTALAQLGGNLSEPIRELRERLVEVAAHVEAALDFVDEDIQFIEPEELRLQLTGTVDQLATILKQLAARGTRSRQPQVMLIGLPNAGKSSLFNALVGSSRAIVSEQAGTTRDLVSAQVQFYDLSCVLTDTAGIEQWQEFSPRKLAQDQLHRSVASADLVLVCFDCRCPDDHAQAQQLLSTAGVPPQRQIVVATKVDLAPSDAPVAADVHTSSLDPELVGELQKLVVKRIGQIQGELQSDSLHRTMVRCSALVASALAAIERALKLLDDPFGDELVASELRHAIDELAAVIGEVHSDDILGEIFSRFCIGK